MFAYIEGPFPYHIVLLFSVLFGVLSGVCYECFRLLRYAIKLAVKPKRKAVEAACKILVFCQDVLYFLVLALFAILFLFVFNRGQLRLSMLLAMLVGFIAYYYTLGRLLFTLYRAILRVSYRICNTIYQYTLRYLFLLTAYLVRKTVGRLYLYVKAVLKRLWLRYLIYSMQMKLSQYEKLAEGGFENMSDDISIM